MAPWTKEVVDLTIAGTSLTIDNIKIDDSNIGHVSDTDLLALASGALTVNGSLSSSGALISLASTGDATIDCGGDITLDASGEQIYFKKDGTSRFVFNLDSSPELDVTGGFTLDCSSTITLKGSQITLDAIADIIIDADGDNIKFRAGGTEVAEFLATGGGRLRLYDDATAIDYLNFNVLENGESYISTVDGSVGGVSAHLHLIADGNMDFDVKATGTYTWNIESVEKLFLHPNGLRVAGAFSCNGKDLAAPNVWTVSNKTGTTRILDCDETDTATLAENLGQLVNDLIDVGILS